MTPKEFHEFLLGMAPFGCHLLKGSELSSPITYTINGTRDCIVALLQLLGYHSGAEIGVQSGAFAEVFVSYLNGPLYLVDPWEHQPTDVYDDIANANQEGQDKRYKYVCDLFKNDNVKIIRAFSEDAIEQVEDESLDYVFIDANHAYDFIKQDLNIWWPKLKIGGMMSGHDLQDTRGVIKAVPEFVNEKGLNYWYVARSAYFFIKPDN